MRALRNAGLHTAIGEANLCSSIDDALERARQIVSNDLSKPADPA